MNVETVLVRDVRARFGGFGVPSVPFGDCY